MGISTLSGEIIADVNDLICRRACTVTIYIAILYDFHMLVTIDPVVYIALLVKLGETQEGGANLIISTRLIN